MCADRSGTAWASESVSWVEGVGSVKALGAVRGVSVDEGVRGEPTGRAWPGRQWQGKEGKPLDTAPLEVDAHAARGPSRVELRGSARTLARAPGKRLVTLLKGGGRL